MKDKKKEQKMAETTADDGNETDEDDASASYRQQLRAVAAFLCVSPFDPLFR